MPGVYESPFLCLRLGRVFVQSLGLRSEPVAVPRSEGNIIPYRLAVRCCNGLRAPQGIKDHYGVSIPVARVSEHYRACRLAAG